MDISSNFTFNQPSYFNPGTRYHTLCVMLYIWRLGVGGVNILRRYLSVCPAAGIAWSRDGLAWTHHHQTLMALFPHPPDWHSVVHSFLPLAMKSTRHIWPETTKVITLKRSTSTTGSGPVYHDAVLETRPISQLKHGEVLVRMGAVGFNHRDVSIVSFTIHTMRHWGRY